MGRVVDCVCGVYGRVTVCVVCICVRETETGARNVGTPVSTRITNCMCGVYMCVTVFLCVCVRERDRDRR